MIVLYSSQQMAIPWKEDHCSSLYIAVFVCLTTSSILSAQSSFCTCNIILLIIIMATHLPLSWFPVIVALAVRWAMYFSDIIRIFACPLLAPCGILHRVGDGDSWTSISAPTTTTLHGWDAVLSLRRELGQRIALKSTVNSKTNCRLIISSDIKPSTSWKLHETPCVWVRILHSGALN